ncbi:MAG: hypothetical protein G01um101416_240 [Microgenomates group bacterium Gr01-1014_16]|nr:MAG: hypothetical protein G01um101416_240 [Microgenomates group bacterium Gr01-1014_16]
MDKQTKATLHVVAFSLAMVGALNWGLVGLLNFDLVATLLGSWPGLVKLVYILVGVSAVYVFAGHKDDCKICGEMMKK